MICSHGQQHGVLSKMSILKGFPNFSRDPWARKLTNQPWESQALLSSLGSEPCVPLGTHTPLLSHHTHHLPGTWRESLPWRAACQELSYPKAPWGAGESSCVKPIVDFLEIWPHFLLVIRELCLLSDKFNLRLFPRTTGNLLCGKYANTA